MLFLFVFTNIRIPIYNLNIVVNTLFVVRVLVFQCYYLSLLHDGIDSTFTSTV
jgi:hypothetical protein